MAFTIRRASSAPPDAVWQALTDFASHAAAVPFTRVEGDLGAGPRLGWTFTMVTGVGPVALRDRMVITEWHPPHHYRVVKTGRGLDGWAEVRVTPAGSGTTVDWTEELGTRIPLARRLSRWVGDRIAPLLFARVIDALLADALLTHGPVGDDRLEHARGGDARRHGLPAPATASLGWGAAR